MTSRYNHPREMGRRLLFLMYVACVTASLITLVVLVADPGWRNCWVAAAVFTASMGFRSIGYRRLDFERLFKSFPTGCALDMIPEEVRSEVEGLVVEFQTPGTEWVRRGEIRRRLIELEEVQPEIIEAYAEDLHRVLAA